MVPKECVTNVHAYLIILCSFLKQVFSFKDVSEIQLHSLMQCCLMMSAPYVIAFPVFPQDCQGFYMIKFYPTL